MKHSGGGHWVWKSPPFTWLTRLALNCFRSTVPALKLAWAVTWWEPHGIIQSHEIKQWNNPRASASKQDVISQPPSFLLISRQTLTAMCLQCQEWCIIPCAHQHTRLTQQQNWMPNDGRSETSHDDYRAIYSPRWHSPLLVPRALRAFRFWFSHTPRKTTANAARGALRAYFTVTWVCVGRWLSTLLT